MQAPAGFYATYVDADGQKKANRALLEIEFRDTARVAVPGFTPSVNGFGFPNRWNDNLPVVTLGWVWNRMREALLDDVVYALGIGAMPEDWIPLTHADSGLCGGMTFAAMDYFLAGRLPDLPAINATGAPIAPVSGSDPLFLHIRDRLLESFDVNGRGSRWLTYTSPLYPDDDEGALQALGIVKDLGVVKGKSWVTYREEWPRIRRELEKGRLVPIGLVQSDEFKVGDNHQVLAYAYEQSAQIVKLWVYDPNMTGTSPLPAIANDHFYEFDTSDTSHRITVTRHNGLKSSESTPIFAIIVMDAYVPKVPPGGVVVPPPGRPKRATLMVTAESFTTGGDIETQTTNKCGEPKRVGNWTSRTSASYVAQISGFARPSVTWSVGGIAVEESATSVEVDFDGSTFRVACRRPPGGRTIEISSQSGESYRTTVEASVKDVDGAIVIASDVFEVSGTYSGLKIEDIVAEAQCIERSIPISVDFGWNPNASVIIPTARGGVKVDEAETLTDEIKADKIDPLLDPDYTVTDFFLK